MKQLEPRIAQLEDELRQSTSMVLLAMTTSSDLGWVIEFLKKAFVAPDLDSLAHGLLQHLQSIGLNSSVWFSGTDKPHCINMNEDDDQIDMLFIQRHRDAGRMYFSENSLLVNFDHVSLLIDNMPEDAEHRGRITDSIATLLEGVESRIEGLIAEEKANDAQKARNEFYSIMSHELKTPLNPIIGFANLLTKRLEGKISDKEFKTLHSIRENGEHLLAIINNLLDLSSIEHGNMTLHRQTFRVDERIKNIKRLVKPAAEKNNTTLNMDTSHEMDFFADSEKFSQIVLNIVANAVKFAKDASVTVTYELEDKDDLGPCLVVTVADTGIGIADENQLHIFDQFTQADTSSTRESGGTGLGLYISNQLVKMHDGRIDLMSEVDQGSTFSIIFPVIS